MGGGGDKKNEKLCILNICDQSSFSLIKTCFFKKNTSVCE